MNTLEASVIRSHTEILQARDRMHTGLRHVLLSQYKNHLKTTGGKIASIIGRYYAMDRDKRWERVKEAYDAGSLQMILQRLDKAFTTLRVRITAIHEAMYISLADSVLKRIISRSTSWAWFPMVVYIALWSIF